MYNGSPCGHVDWLWERGKCGNQYVCKVFSLPYNLVIQILCIKLGGWAPQLLVQTFFKALKWGQGLGSGRCRSHSDLSDTSWCIAFCTDISLLMQPMQSQTKVESHQVRKKSYLTSPWIIQAIQGSQIDWDWSWKHNSSLYRIYLRRPTHTQYALR